VEMSIEDPLFEEVEYACAYCGQHGKENLTIHHIDHNKSNNEYDNQIILCHNCHHRYNQNKGISKDDILKLKLHLIKKTLTQYGINALKISYRNNFGVIAMPYMLSHLLDLGYMSKEETESTYMDANKEVERTTFFTITDKGKKFYEKWLLPNFG
jgi:predicted transcriptional regulator